MGYTLVKGKQWSEVPDTVTIFASPSCHRVLRRGKNNPNEKVHEATNNAEIKKAIEYEVKHAKPKVSGIGGAIVNATGGIFDLPDNITDTIANERTKESINEELNTGGHTQTPIIDEITSTEEYYKTNLEKLNAVTEKLKSLDFPVTTVYGLAQWFDDMEAVIDALPSMSEDGGTVYVVEKGEDGKWRYTGDSEPMDREWNAKLQDAKASACLWLQKQMDKATSKIETVLQEHINRMENCGPVMRVISIIQKVPTIADIIDWAKGIIDFIVSIYKMIYSLYKMTVQMLELIIIRFPQLVNKFMQKVTEYNCPISSNIQINVKK